MSVGSRSIDAGTAEETGHEALNARRPVCHALMEPSPRVFGPGRRPKQRGHDGMVPASPKARSLFQGVIGNNRAFGVAWERADAGTAARAVPASAVHRHGSGWRRQTVAL